MSRTEANALVSVAASLDAARDRAIELLRHHYALGTLGMEAFEQRVELAERAILAQELVVLTSDLPVLSEANPGFSRVPVALREMSARVPENAWSAAIFGGFERKGTWTLARMTRLLTCFGGGELDLRAVRFANEVYTLDLLCVMGGISIVVPPWVRVECSVGSLFGGTAHQLGRPEAEADGPVLRIRGLVVMGGLDIAQRLPGESPRDAKKRLKAEALELRSAETSALPAAKR